jgi:hypothetical protein
MKVATNCKSQRLTTTGIIYRYAFFIAFSKVAGAIIIVS